MLFLANGKQKFREKAVWFPQVTANDGERLSYSISGFTFKCARYEPKFKDRNIIDGVGNRSVSLAVITDDAKASEFTVNDKIKYKGHDYTIVSHREVRNYSSMLSVAYVLGLN